MFLCVERFLCRGKKKKKRLGSRQTGIGRCGFFGVLHQSQVAFCHQGGDKSPPRIQSPLAAIMYIASSKQT